ncbi:hypothetical protein Q4575_07800 [Psychrosphaera sp. 1_MG-2023]|uniref:Uncharacterized protein n=1 Tax=Psychrosphaera algicola TaxID=3023714 RepID=A0ABT5FDF6_9GAMM|nr:MULTISPECIES: hypothetical protein [unclassified Psychrosphaera]MDC2888883.1 hypothetical protein [Psychrosphaera sp. G1-22]MDO6719297.1 hypothetical protein [Psychrosphaera sp. 1_MG-2023]
MFNNTRRRIARKTISNRLLSRRLKQTTIRMGESNADPEEII